MQELIRMVAVIEENDGKGVASDLLANDNTKLLAFCAICFFIVWLIDVCRRLKKRNILRAFAEHKIIVSVTLVSTISILLGSLIMLTFNDATKAEKVLKKYCESSIGHNGEEYVDCISLLYLAIDAKEEKTTLELIRDEAINSVNNGKIEVRIISDIKTVEVVGYEREEFIYDMLEYADKLYYYDNYSSEFGKLFKCECDIEITDTYLDSVNVINNIVCYVVEEYGEYKIAKFV